jgi:SAM-dependent methyltransferase
MPDYQNNLYSYYKHQEYLILYRFLTYPFSSELSSHRLPYEKALDTHAGVDVLDYGAGIPYGLILSLLKNKCIVNSITLIDLDLVHVEFATFLINKIAPDTKLVVHKLTDTNAFPRLEGRYDVFYGKDVFEHLSDPRKALVGLLNCSKNGAVCYFDFSDHGDRIYQHLTPNLEFLSAEMEGLGFTYVGKVGGLSEFVRSA